MVDDKHMINLKNIGLNMAVVHYNDCYHYVRKVFSKDSSYIVFCDCLYRHTVCTAISLLNHRFGLSLPELVSLDLSQLHYVATFDDNSVLLLHKDYGFDSILAQLIYKFSININS